VEEEESGSMGPALTDREFPESMIRPMRSRSYPWYDSQWLDAYQRARVLITARYPDRLSEFDHAMSVFRTRADFQVKHFSRIFDDEVTSELRRVAAALAPDQLELHEARSFRRFVVHDHAYFRQLQERVVDMASEAADEPLESAYNFLSLYGPQGVCPLHLDAPLAKWTLDLCIDQSGPWPIYFAPVAPWPQPDAYGSGWEDQVKRDVGRGFSAHTLMPGEAVLFSGSSQWHYRDPMPGSGAARFCDLLFFHFIPRGTAELVQPGNWAHLFGIAELADQAPYD
jgi:hypothetical protein